MAAVDELGDAGADVARGRGSIDAVGSSSSSSRGTVQHRLGEARRVCSPDDSTPALVRRYFARS